MAKIKPLEWKITSFNAQSATSIIGCYFIEYRQPLDKPREWYWHPSGAPLVRVGDEAAAIAAAQADYEAHIRSALTSDADARHADMLATLKRLVEWHGRRRDNETLAPIDEQYPDIAKAMHLIAKAEEEI